GRVRRPRDGVPHLRQGGVRAGNGFHQADPGGLSPQAPGRTLLMLARRRRRAAFSYVRPRRRPRAPSPFPGQAGTMTRTCPATDPGAQTALLRLVTAGGPLEP